MIHLGDITKISGYTAPIVDCIVGGSPCQDLSIAGKRAGLDGERSGLFMDQVRIVKEMRDKALGNSISLPNWKWVMKRLCACYERDATLASLFDGIGGFPYIWEQINGKGSCLWASEIEEFPIAVTKVRIGE